MVWYRRQLFRCLPDMSYTDSKLFLWVLFALFVIIGILMTWKRRRNYISIITNIAFPYEIYYILTYRADAPKFFTVACVFTALLSLTYMILVFVSGRKEKAKRQHYFSTRIRHGILGSRVIAAWLLLLVVLPAGVKATLGYSLFRNTEPPLNSFQGETCTIENNMDTLLNLLQRNWDNISKEERLATLQVVANIEAHSLGLPHELNVTVGTLGENVISAYDDNIHTIIISSNYFASSTAIELLDSVAHESYHAYQHRLCEVYDAVNDVQQELSLFDDIRFFKYEFDNYCSSNENLSDYFNQRCESTARSYATGCVLDYYTKLNLYIAEIDSANESE